MCPFAWGLQLTLVGNKFERRLSSVELTRSANIGRGRWDFQCESCALLLLSPATCQVALQSMPLHDVMRDGDDDNDEGLGPQNNNVCKGPFASARPNDQSNSGLRCLDFMTHRLRPEGG